MAQSDSTMAQPGLAMAQSDLAMAGPDLATARGTLQLGVGAPAEVGPCWTSARKPPESAQLDLEPAQEPNCATTGAWSLVPTSARTFDSFTVAARGSLARM